MEFGEFVERSIIDSLELDHENFENLANEVRQSCKDDGIIFHHDIFVEILSGLVRKGRVAACLYSEQDHNLAPVPFREEGMMDYWFCLVNEDKLRRP